MPINSTITIKGSVGRRGSNSLNDVRTIQTRLNELMRPPRRFLTVDGRSGPMTENAIADFQRVVRGSANPDSRVDPGGKTLMALNDPASEGKWAQMSIGAPAAVGGAAATGGGAGSYPAGATAQEKAAIDAARKSAEAARKAGSPVALELLGLMLESDYYGHFKNVFNSAGAVHWAAEFGKSIQGMSMAGLTATEIRLVFVQFNQQGNRGGLTKVLEEFRSRPALAGSVGKLAKIGKVLNAAGYVFAVLEIGDHLSMRRYGPACAEIYSTFMGTMVPWAGLISSVQEVAFAYAPGLRGQPAVNYFFRLLNAADPIGLGKIGVDSVVTLIETAMTSYQRGSLDMRQMEQLVDRMNKTPASVLVEWGNKIGNYFGEKTGAWFYENFLK